MYAIRSYYDFSESQAIEYVEDYYDFYNADHKAENIRVRRISNNVFKVSLSRITSYNVCYTKLLRKNFIYEKI